MGSGGPWVTGLKKPASTINLLALYACYWRNKFLWL
jgi:hypothetical protein